MSRASKSSSASKAQARALKHGDSSLDANEPKDENDPAQSNKAICWDLEKRGRPVCCICMDLARPPVRLPCTCSSLMCLACFDTFMSSYSNCLVCRERIVPRLRRLCSGGKPLSSLVDQELATYIEKRFGSDEISNDTIVPIKVEAPAPGELKAEAEKLLEEHQRQRRAEEEASVALIEQLRVEGDLDLKELERLAEDEILARKLQENLAADFQAANSRKGANSALKSDVQPRRLFADSRATENFKSNSIDRTVNRKFQALDGTSLLTNYKTLVRSSSSSSSHARDQHVDKSEEKAKKDIVILLQDDDETDPVAGGAIRDALNTGQGMPTSKRIRASSSSSSNALLSSEADENRATLQRPLAFDEVIGNGKSKNGTGSSKKTWTCQVCTYDMTEVRWLSCEMCGSSKHFGTLAASSSFSSES